MKLDDANDLLDKARGDLVSHPVAFPEHNTIYVKRETALATVLECLQGYQKREFIVTPDNYGVEVSLNYSGGKFKSMILKGTGDQGEIVNDSIALMLVPKEAHYKGEVTLHALLTIQDLFRFRGGTPKLEVERILKYALREGFRPYEDKKMVCRPYTLFVDAKRHNLYKVWDKIAGNLLITGLYMEYTFDELKDNLQEDMLRDFKDYLVPVRGIVVEDSKPEDEKAFPTTRFLFDETVVDEAREQEL